MFVVASQCSPLPETPHANGTVLNGGGRSYGTIVRFECEPGYVRSGHPVILCMSNGTWSSNVPTCSRKFSFSLLKNELLINFILSVLQIIVKFTSILLITQYVVLTIHTF